MSGSFGGLFVKAKKAITMAHRKANDSRIVAKLASSSPISR